MQIPLRIVKKVFKVADGAVNYFNRLAKNLRLCETLQTRSNYC